MSVDVPKVGDIVARRYRVEERLGHGSTGVVYRATQVRLGREVALKVLHPRFVTDPQARARFEREARVASALDHPSAVSVYDFGEDGHCLYLTMELLEGRTLRQRLSEPGEVPVAEILDLGAQLADVLSAAHQLPLVHRDLKPANVFLVPADGERAAGARVVDFGLAFIAGSAREDRMTAHGVVTGTPEYLSPEQTRGGEVGPPTDVYALGCMLYELVTGTVPFHGTDMEVLTKQMFAAPPALGEHHRTEPLPTAIDRLIVRMLDKRPAHRPEAMELVVAFADLDRTRDEGPRNDAHLLGRTARMVGQAPGASASAGGEGIEVAVLGDVDGELWVALAANGIAAWAATPSDLPAKALVYAPGAPRSEIARLCADGYTVLSDTDPGDATRIGDLVSAGAAEVVLRPVAAEDLSRRLLRVARRLTRDVGA
ncbi:MAG: serine/threonine protein kinase [Deltaproteobacteria bacterium]|nr:serine/threonine protein kinase [Deltaproteobacteria bacterium]